MPRRQFVSDLESSRKGSLPFGITNVRAGEDDGQIEFFFNSGSTARAVGPAKITALVPDLDDYPKNHEYMIYGDDSTPLDILAALAAVRGTDRKTVSEMLEILSATLQRLQPDQDGDMQMPDSQFDDEREEEDSDGSIYGSDHEDFVRTAPVNSRIQAASIPTPALSISDGGVRNRIREDLRITKEAGFKVGVLGQLFDGANAFVTVSIRMSKLGISDEAMQAWQVEPSDYLTLLIQYPNGYKTNEEFQAYDGMRFAPSIAMRVLAGKKYKPTLQEAICAFTTARKRGHQDDAASTKGFTNDDESDTSSVRSTFISKSLADLLQDRLIPVLRYRSVGMTWNGAEAWFHEQQHAGPTRPRSETVPDQFFQADETNSALSPIVNADHYASLSREQYSFPLVAMQFLLRHFVRCTEFCLVCHKKLGTDVEAIKPYVCDNHLCLFQYMALGFGPSIEHEIVAQPYVVDLLISFCYNSAASRKLKEFPDGLSLLVPPLDRPKHPPSSAWHTRSEEAKPPPVQTGASTSRSFEAGYDSNKLELLFPSQSKSCPVRKGSWIVFTPPSADGTELHCRVSDTTFFPSVKVDPPVAVNAPSTVTRTLTVPSRISQLTPSNTRPASPTGAPQWSSITFQVYDMDFQELETVSKCLTICKLLDTLPSVPEMKAYLARDADAAMKGWVQRVSPAALSLLRWIIASNRACIMQVDGKVDATRGKDVQLSGVGRKQERLYGMKDYMQFRFATGAPDKEQRFIAEVRETQERLKLRHPTIFAFHGSPLPNWHMIIREGLHYKNLSHGRAFGDGVYHAKDAQTSIGYSGARSGNQGSAPEQWPGSILRISSALALNEIVNAPAEYVSQNPFYVVPQLDWIQTRYLFVHCSPDVQHGVEIGPEQMPVHVFAQDPKATPRGTSDNIVIPASAVKSRKVPNSHSGRPTPSKKIKLGQSATDAADMADDDQMSDATDVEDLEMLFEELSESNLALAPLAVSSQKKAHTEPKTNFAPASLDFNTLPLMPLPTYASPATTTRLMKDLISLQKVQENTPLSDLGWFIDVEKIENVYQWIVEMHSFHTIEVGGKMLPLAADMKQREVKSLVLEVRFNKDFPFTPPYVRVVRPRLLTIAQGGGGHVVAGGALCMELLTNSGWSSVSSMESVLMQVRMAIASEPFARLDTTRIPGLGGDYGTGEAAEGYMRACRTHGWQVPPGFQELAYGTGMKNSARR